MAKIAFFEIKEDWQKEMIYNQLNGNEIKIYKETINEINLDEIRDFEIISVFIYSKVNREVLDKLPNIREIVTNSTGFDHIDLIAAKEKDIKVLNVPFYGQNTVAEFAFGLLLNISRHVCKSISRVRSGSFDVTGLRGFDLTNKKVGVVGFGHIGQKFAKMCKGFEMNVLVYDKRDSPFIQEKVNELGAKRVELDELFRESDVISLHLPLTPETRHILNEGAFNMMKNGVIILNTARGDLIDSWALLNALRNKKVLAAGLDVLEGEYLIKEDIAKVLDDIERDKYNSNLALYDHILMEHPSVFVTPHNAFNSIDALKRILNTTIYNIKQYLNNDIKENLVN